jgi:DNA repair exonuclease SbcCD nuclease subunit
MRIDDDSQRNLMSLDTEKQFNVIINKAIEERVDFVVHSGDLFDRINVKNADIESALKALRRLSENEIPFVTIAGNHDKAFTQGVVSPLNFINYIDKCTAITEIGTKVFKVGNSDISVHGISYIRSEIEDRYPEALGELINNSHTKFNILLSHQLVNGSKTGYEISSVNEPEIPSTFFPPDLNYVAMGHIHKKQNIKHPSYPEMKIHYPGSPLIIDFGERKEKKSISIVNITGEEVELNEIGLESRKFEEISIKLDNPTSSEAEETLKTKIESKINSENYLGIRLNGGMQIALRKYAAVGHYLQYRNKFAGFDIYYDKNDFTWYDQKGSAIETTGNWLLKPKEELQTAIKDQEELNKKQKDRLLRFGTEIIKERFGGRV